MNIKVYDTTKPTKKAWDMSEKGFEKLSSQFPGKFAIFQQISQPKKNEVHTVVVDKISYHKIETQPLHPTSNSKIEVRQVTKRGNPKPTK